MNPIERLDAYAFTCSVALFILSFMETVSCPILMWGGVAGAALGGVIMVLADQTHAHLHSHKH